MRPFIPAALAASAFVATGARASETVTYTYDVRGRLVQVVHSGSVNAGASTAYAYDKANNRLSKTTAGAP